MATALLVVVAAALQTFSAHVVGVHDGDTITVIQGRQQTRIRLEGIDAPELGQAFGQAAKRRTATLVFARDVVIRPKELDRHGRLVARVVVDREDVSLVLVQDGLAWHFKRYSGDEALARAEDQARRGRRGLWQEPNPIPPWDFRRRRSETSPDASSTVPSRSTSSLAPVGSSAYASTTPNSTSPLGAPGDPLESDAPNP